MEFSHYRPLRGSRRLSAGSRPGSGPAGDAPGRGAILGILALVLTAGAYPAAAQTFSRYQQEFGTVSLAVSGGFQMWSLEGVEAVLDARGELFRSDGYSFETAQFDPTYGFGVELQMRLSESYYFRSQFEWTRLSWEDRDRSSVSFLGGRVLTPISLGYTTRVQTRPFLLSLGLGRSQRYDSVRWGLSGNWIMAPIRVSDELVVFMQSETVSEVESTGFGHGFEAALSLDYFTDTNMTLYVEGYWRNGSTVVELEDSAWESTILPDRRRVDFDGAGLRMGFRWI